MKILETERLVLDWLQPEDDRFMYELLNSPGWLRYIGNRNVGSVEHARAYIQGRIAPAYTDPGFGFYAVRLKDSGETIGICGLVKRENLDDVDIGFAFLPPYEGKGFGYESASAVLSYAFAKLGMKRIVAITNQDNLRSIALLEKIGLKFEKIIDHNGEDLVLMGIDKPDNI